MAGITCLGRRYVVGRLAGSRRAVVTGRAGARGQTGMAECRGLPCVRAMASVTGSRRGDVVGGFAFANSAVVAHRAATGLKSGMGKRRRRPCLVLMTCIALLRGRNMVAVLGRARKAAARLVASIAVLGCALKYTALMTALATGSCMCARQRKACEAVINLRAARQCLRISQITNQESSGDHNQQLQNTQRKPTPAEARRQRG